MSRLQEGWRGGSCWQPAGRSTHWQHIVGIQRRCRWSCLGCERVSQGCVAGSLLDGARTGNDELGKLGLEPKAAEKKQEKRPKVRASQLCKAQAVG